MSPLGSDVRELIAETYDISVCHSNPHNMQGTAHQACPAEKCVNKPAQEAKAHKHATAMTSTLVWQPICGIKPAL